MENISRIQGRPPYELFLEADPSKDLIDQYLKEGKAYGYRVNDELIAAYILVRLDQATYELKNIAVREDYRLKGIVGNS